MTAPTMAMVSTFPPTQCGIATFARSLERSIRSAGASTVRVELGDDPDLITPDEAAGPGRTVRLAAPDDLPLAIREVNAHDLALIQHEFGIYSGRDGADVLELVSECSVPVITVAHTVLPAPSGHQRHVFQTLLDRSTAVVTLSGAARKQLLRHYSVAAERVHVIPRLHSIMNSPMIT